MNLRTSIAVILCIFLSVLSFGQDGIPLPPDPPRLVNDYTATTLSAAEINTLEQKLLGYEDSTSTQIAVLIVNTTEPYEIADFTQRTGQKWGVGSSKDNGIMIVIAVEDRLAHIATGYGMEGAIPDAAAYTIITNEMRPEFRQGNYYRGIDRATDVIIALASGEYTADELTSGEEFPVGLLIFLILLFIVFPIWVSYKSRGYQDYGSRGVPWWLFMGGGSGRRGTGWGDFSGGSGGFGGGGGFGGFGGGGFGGGGATGGW